jgi:excisionase family DNA binding protein
MASYLLDFEHAHDTVAACSMSIEICWSKADMNAMKREQTDSGLLTIKETADFLRLTVSTLRAWVLHRQIAFVKMGGKRVLFRRSDLQKLVESSVVPAKDQKTAQSIDGQKGRAG